MICGFGACQLRVMEFCLGFRVWGLGFGFSILSLIEFRLGFRVVGLRA